MQKMAFWPFCVKPAINETLVFAQKCHFLTQKLTYNTDFDPKSDLDPVPGSKLTLRRVKMTPRGVKMGPQTLF
jgi:hypothetical protein